MHETVFACPRRKTGDSIARIGDRAERDARLAIAKSSIESGRPPIALQPGPETLCRDFESAWNAHDMAALGRLFREDAVFVGRYGTTLRGRHEIESTHRKIHDGAYRSSTLTVRDPEVSSLSEDIAIMMFGTRLAIGGDAASADQLIETVAQAVATRTGGTWLLQSMANVEVTHPGS